MIRLENVSKYYVGNNEVALGLRKINLEFTKGEMVAITGESGSGKSTLLNVISGSDTYEEGELYIDNQTTSYFDEKDWENYRRDYIGFIYQSYNLIDSYTVFENINIALVIKGCTGDNTEKVMEYLDRVGLKEHAHKKATRLSSGQKQRLAIARALAKETEILVADEPTGNLDSENSAQIMELLHSLSKDKLVIVVTHNYDEIEPYATRKIRMYNGEVAEDINLREKNLSQEATKKADDEKKTNSKKEVVKKITWLNKKNKPVTFAFLMSFMVAVAAAFFILLGGFFSNLDQTTSKIFDSNRFANKDINRLIVMKNDGSEITKEDEEELASIDKVTYVDKYDVLNDTVYMSQENEDYRLMYNVRQSKANLPNYCRAVPISEDKFMRSVSGLSEDDLRTGVMAKGIYEIVIYAEDDSLLGRDVRLYVSNKTYWGSDVAEMIFTVTGILKEETDQVYFSEKFGKMLQIDPNKYAEIFKEREKIDTENDLQLAISILTLPGEVDTPSLVMFEEDEYSELSVEEQKEEIAGSTSTKVVQRPVFIINEELTGNEIIVSSEFKAHSYSVDSSGSIHPYDFYNIVSYSIYDNSNEATITKIEGSIERLEKSISDYKRYIDRGYDHWKTPIDDEYRQIMEDQIEDWQAEVDEYNETLEELKLTLFPCKVTLEIQNKETKSAANVIEVSEEFFEKYVGSLESSQAAVYMEDYAYADRVLEAIDSEKYTAASVYRIGAIEYDEELVEKKATSMFISLGAFFMMFFIGVYIIGLIMNLSSKDFRIFRLLGMDRDEINAVNKRSIITNMMLAVFLGLVIIFILNIINISYIKDIVKYYRWYHYLVYFAAISLFSLLLSARRKAATAKIQ